MVTRSTGLNSLVEIMREDAVFPTTREELVTRQGWKVFDETETRRIRAAEYLSHLPDGTYKNLDQVKVELSSIVR